MQKLLINIQNLNLQINQFKLLIEDVKIYQGDSVEIVGHNGAGKSMLTKCLLNIASYNSGKIEIAGKTPRNAQDIIGYIPQSESIDKNFPITALQVALMGMYQEFNMFGFPSSYQYEKAAEALKYFGIEKDADSHFGSLSEGHRKRVLLARILLQKDAIIHIYDEPFCNLDRESYDILLNSIETLQKQGKTVICIHHENEIGKYFNKTLKMYQGSGMIIDKSKDKHI